MSKSTKRWLSNRPPPEPEVLLEEQTRLQKSPAPEGREAESASRRKDAAVSRVSFDTVTNSHVSSLMTQHLIELTKPPEEASKDPNSLPALDCCPLYCVSVLDLISVTLAICWLIVQLDIELYLFLSFRLLYATCYVSTFSWSPFAVTLWSCIVFSFNHPSIHPSISFCVSPLMCRTMKSLMMRLEML